MKKMNVTFRVIACACIIAVSYPAMLASRFLLDEESVRTGLTEKSGDRKKSEFPPYIVTNISAQLIPNVKGAVRVSWDVDPDSTDEFIVGRSVEIPDTKEKALNASSIKLLPAGAPGMMIDSNLAPGAYYYVVLSKEKARNRDVEIYPDVNYTSSPVIVEKEAPPEQVRMFPPQVTLLHGHIINQTQIDLSWKAVDEPGIVYTVYRSGERLGSPEAIRKAERIAVITEKRESYVDKSITTSGMYFYAVTTKDIAGNEDLQLIPDQSYLANGLYVTFRTQAIISGLKAGLYENDRVELSWHGINAPNIEYVVYRHDKPIADVQRLAHSAPVGKVGPKMTSYIDKPTLPGIYYYAVLVRLEDATIDNTLRDGENYTVLPVEMKPAPHEPPGAEIKPPIVKKEPEKTPEIMPEAELPATPPMGVELIVKETFFKGRYAYAVKKLNNALKATDNEREAAMARLFIGRSLVEMKRYRESLPYFIMPDVKKHFPAEANFWREYAISRVR